MLLSMLKLQECSPRSFMAYFPYHGSEFHFSFLLRLYPECSLSGLLSFSELWYFFCVRLRALTQAVHGACGEGRAVRNETARFGP